MRRQLAQDRRRLFVAAGGQRAAVAAADMSGKRVAGEMIRQPGQPLRHFAELLIDMQIQIQIPAAALHSRFSMAAASQLEEWMKPPSRQRSPLLATVRAMASACASSRNKGSGISATRSR